MFPGYKGYGEANNYIIVVSGSNFRSSLDFFSKKKRNFQTHFENNLVLFVASKEGPKGVRKGEEALCQSYKTLQYEINSS